MPWLEQSVQKGEESHDFKHLMSLAVFFTVSLVFDLPTCIGEIITAANVNPQHRLNASVFPALRILCAKLVPLVRQIIGLICTALRLAKLNHTLYGIISKVIYLLLILAET